MFTQTPRSPDSHGSLASMAAEAKRSALKVPTRLMAMTVSKLWSRWGPREPAIFSGQPTPAQQIEMRRPSSPDAATAASTAART